MNEKSLEREKPLISVIVPVYNVEAYLPECLESILAQTYGHLEILLIDDGSTDGSGAICDQYAAKDARIRCVHTENHGVSHARNLALSMATGEYLGFVDADDWIAEEWYEILLRAIQQDASDICIGRFTGDTKKRYWTATFPGNACVFQMEEALQEMFSLRSKQLFFWTLCDKLFHRRLIPSTAFDEGVHVTEDMVVCARALMASHRISYRPFAGYFYRLRKGSATQGGLSKDQEETSVLPRMDLWKIVNDCGSDALIRMIAPFCSLGSIGYLRHLLAQTDYVDHKQEICEIQREIRAQAKVILLAGRPTLRQKIGCLYFCLPYRVVVWLRKWACGGA